MIDKIIIITTAVARIDLHNICFPNYKRFLGKTYDIKWFINIDKPTYCTDDLDDVEQNLKILLAEYNPIIFKSTIPNFFYAVKSLLTASKEHLTDNSCVLWLEDDWIMNKECSIQYFIDKFFKPYSLISLVYNMLGSFPPFMMGGSLAKKFYHYYMLYDLPDHNPETVSRTILKTISKEIGIIYYNFLDNIRSLKLVRNPIDSGLIYTEAYFKIDDCRILCNARKKQFAYKFATNDVISIDNMVLYNGENSGRIIFLRFGTSRTNAKYKHSYFRDLGRQWKKDHMEKLYLAQK